MDLLLVLLLLFPTLNLLSFWIYLITRSIIPWLSLMRRLFDPSTRVLLLLLLLLFVAVTVVVVVGAGMGENRGCSLSSNSFSFFSARMTFFLFALDSKVTVNEFNNCCILSTWSLCNTYPFSSFDAFSKIWVTWVVLGWICSSSNGLRFSTDIWSCSISLRWASKSWWVLSIVLLI